MTTRIILFLAACGVLGAHCDGLDGPVAKAAREALASGNVNPALIWVKAADEPEVRRVFAHALAVRKLGGEAQSLADTFFLESVVRLHRAGEGAPYTGLKPAGRDLGPAIAAADNAVELGSSDAVARLLSTAAAEGVRERFDRVAAKRKFAKNDVAAGREYVQAYVEFLHYVEGLHQAAHRGEAHEH